MMIMMVSKPAHILILRLGAMHDIAVREHDSRADHIIDDHAVFAGQIAEAASEGESAWGQRGCPGEWVVGLVGWARWLVWITCGVHGREHERCETRGVRREVCDER
jgi:hypothetical protein